MSNQGAHIRADTHERQSASFDCKFDLQGSTPKPIVSTPGANVQDVKILQNTSLYIIHISTDETGKIRLVSCVGWCSCLRRITVDLNTETHTSAAASHWNIASWASMSNQHQGTCSLQSFPYNIKPAKNMMYISKAVGASGNRDCNDGSANCITRAIGHQRLKRDAKGCRECWPTAGVFALSTQILWTSTLIDSCMLRLRPPD